MRFITIIDVFFIFTITLSNFIITVSSAYIPDLCGSPPKNKNTEQTALVLGSCTKFYQCDEGEVVVKQCKQFTKYDSITGKCIGLDGNEPAFFAIIVVMMTDTTEEAIL
ncbi:hypothetical protein BDC45DRAFT_538659 [Circinella umbellata]|nr:hypothetical protein BDC45DRAFT_538659 [Circinella umbellata]